jgi:hypothetical protein
MQRIPSLNCPHAREQHSLSLEHVSPALKQVGPTSQVVPLQLFEQQSESCAQSPPRETQTASWEQVPLSQPSEQQSAALVHESPSRLHPPFPARHVPCSPQRPEQQLDPLTQAAP